MKKRYIGTIIIILFLLWIYFGNTALVDGVNYYPDILSAINEKTTSTIKILRDTVECITIDGTRTITIDMNGYTLDCANDVPIFTKYIH